MNGWNNQPTDLRGLRRRRERNLLFLVVLVLLVVGGLLIGLIYGRTAFIASLGCLIPGVGMIIAIWVVLLISDWLIGRDK